MTASSFFTSAWIANYFSFVGVAIIVKFVSIFTTSYPVCERWFEKYVPFSLPFVYLFN